ncbi:hypothetical protein SELMODRAFT_411235 [Selaginella moellendorffii]|uniref:Protein kinase domain-containing protein n=1 Tax=Selaginella moellendorffii TaxID=88036 RepID=D8RH02_SELML|nr:hypothetical protein SELMODRAFT_411235 [Selaginella moellendorffii]
MADRNFSSSALLGAALHQAPAWPQEPRVWIQGAESFGLGRSSRRNVAICSIGIAESMDRALGRGLKRSDFVMGQKLGEGSFGTVYAGAILPKDFHQEQGIGKRSRRLEEHQGFQKVTLKKVKMDVEGALESGEMEEGCNYRMARAALDVCADFLGSFVADSTRGRFVEGGKLLVWKYEGDSTLADFMKDRRFPKNLAEPLLGRSREKDPLKRKALMIRRILREILAALKKMHATGIVHRDVRPANLVVTNKAELKNYVPERGMLDPDHFPPELFVMPEETPRPPPAPIAVLLSPILSHLSRTDRSSSYFTPMACSKLMHTVSSDVDISWIMVHSTYRYTNGSLVGVSRLCQLLVLVIDAELVTDENRAMVAQSTSLAPRPLQAAPVDKNGGLACVPLELYA